jgi:hypothetical protein
MGNTVAIKHELECKPRTVGDHTRRVPREHELSDLRTAFNLEQLADAFFNAGEFDVSAGLRKVSAELDAYRALLADARAQSAAEQERLS